MPVRDRGTLMQTDKSPVIGIILVVAGLLILLRNSIDVDIYDLRSYGLFLVGCAGFYYGVTKKPPRSIFLFSFLTLTGLYYVLAEMNMFYPDRGLTISVIMLIIAASFVAKYVFVRTQWQYLLFASIFAGIGVLFLLFVLDIISAYRFDRILSNYWPVVLILAGLGFLINSLQFGKKTTDIAQH